jgi:hypothetical protein
MKNSEFSDRKNARRKQLENKKFRQKKNLSDETYGYSKLNKEYKNKKNEIRADELWEDWQD